jgi:hypothetical protein
VACPVSASHSFTVRSALPEARIFPSAENATDQIASVCPSRTASSFLVATSQIRTVRSALLVANFLPSGEKTAENTLLVCPVNSPSSLPAGDIP